VKSSRNGLTFQENILPSFSMSKNKQIKETSITTQKADHGFFFYPEDVDRIFLQNAGGILPDYTALHSGRFIEICF
jgi:hypothetical protein